MNAPASRPVVVLACAGEDAGFMAPVMRRLVSQGVRVDVVAGVDLDVRPFEAALDRNPPRSLFVVCETEGLDGYQLDMLRLAAQCSGVDHDHLAIVPFAGHAPEVLVASLQPRLARLGFLDAATPPSPTIRRATQAIGLAQAVAPATVRAPQAVPAPAPALAPMVALAPAQPVVAPPPPQVVAPQPVVVAPPPPVVAAPPPVVTPPAIVAAPMIGVPVAAVLEDESEAITVVREATTDSIVVSPEIVEPGGTMRAPVPRTVPRWALPAAAILMTLAGVATVAAVVIGGADEHSTPIAITLPDLSVEVTAPHTPELAPAPAPAPTVETAPVPPASPIVAALEARRIRALDHLLVARQDDVTLPHRLAAAQCRNLGEAGLRGWRLPTTDELIELGEAGFLPKGTWWWAAKDRGMLSRITWDADSGFRRFGGKSTLAKTLCVRGAT